MRWIASSGSPKMAENGLFEGFLKIINRSRAILFNYLIVYAALASRYGAIFAIARGVVARCRSVRFPLYSIMNYG